MECIHSYLHNIRAKAGVGLNTYRTPFILIIVCLLFSCNARDEKSDSEKTKLNSLAKDDDSTLAGDSLFLHKTKKDINQSLILANLDSSRHAALIIDFLGFGKNERSCVYSPSVDKIMKGKHAAELDSAALWKIMRRLNTKELLYFCTAYPCQYAQICSRFHPDKETMVHKYPPTVYEGYIMNYQQLVALRKKRKEVIALLLKCMKTDGFVYNDTFFRLVDDLNGWELIPLLINTNDDSNARPKVITLIFHFMEHDGYEPITQNPAYSKMYSSGAITYPYTPELFEQVKKYAIQFYQSKIKS